MKKHLKEALAGMIARVAAVLFVLLLVYLGAIEGQTGQDVIEILLSAQAQSSPFLNLLAT